MDKGNNYVCQTCVGLCASIRLCHLDITLGNTEVPLLVLMRAMFILQWLDLLVLFLFYDHAILVNAKHFDKHASHEIMLILTYPFATF